jgi:hypothetical protein
MHPKHRVAIYPGDVLLEEFVTDRFDQVHVHVAFEVSSQMTDVLLSRTPQNESFHRIARNWAVR